MKFFRLLCGLTVCLLSAVVWWVNFSQSPMRDHDYKMQRQYVNSMYDKFAPDLQQERVLAIDYWLRYSDVRNDAFWGENSRLGVKGPEDHYRQHGRREGRIYATISRPEDMVLERELAEAYWQQNPDVAKSTIWGRHSSLGILGPRDHYQFYGKRQGRKWGE